ncbi:MAG: Flp family type IVb pilin [Alphaproteobacteria bacterium]
MRNIWTKFWREETGATALEYGLIVALIVTGLVVALNTFATQTTGMYNVILTAWQNAIN